MAKPLVLVRNGETDWNRTGRLQGQQGESLNARGREQALALALGLRALGAKFNVLLSSDLPRAHETASIVADRLHFKPRFDPRLRATALGCLEGLTRAEIARDYGDRLCRVLNEPRYVYDFAPFGGEHYNDVTARQSLVLEGLRVDRQVCGAIIIGHSRSLNSLIRKYWESTAFMIGDCRLQLVDLK